MEATIKIKQEPEDPLLVPHEMIMVKQERVKAEPVEPLQDPAVHKKTKYTNEQKVVAATWWHERKFNFQSAELIKKNFRIRFRRDPPKIKILEKWEKRLFSKGILTSNKASKEGSEGSDHSEGNNEGSDEDVEKISIEDSDLDIGEGDLSD